jgi:hypothetical protein
MGSKYTGSSNAFVDVTCLWHQTATIFVRRPTGFWEICPECRAVREPFDCNLLLLLPRGSGLAGHGCRRKYPATHTPPYLAG